MTDETCVDCGRALTYRAKPKVAFTRRGCVMGSAHSSNCTPAKMRRSYRKYGYPESDAAAAFYIFDTDERERAPRNSPRYFAHLLVLGERDRQEQLFDWWQRGPLQLPPTTISEIRTARVDLTRDIAEWRASR